MWALGTLGCELIQGSDLAPVMDVYFEHPLSTEINALICGNSSLADARLVLAVEMEPEDWLAAYRNRVKPFEVGEVFLVDSREPSAIPVFDQSSRKELRIPARNAFGTGSHASTRLVVEFLENLDLKGSRVVDLGTGTGILSLVADHLGAASVVAVDTDVVAAFAAREVGSLNGMRIAVLAGRIGCLSSARLFDLALVNILPTRVAADLRDLVDRLDTDGEVIFSGILDVDVIDVRSDIALVGLEAIDERRDGEWLAIRARRVST